MKTLRFMIGFLVATAVIDIFSELYRDDVKLIVNYDCVAEEGEE